MYVIIRFFISLLELIDQLKVQRQVGRAVFETHITSKNHPIMQKLSKSKLSSVSLQSQLKEMQ